MTSLILVYCYIIQKYMTKYFTAIYFLENGVEITGYLNNEEHISFNKAYGFDVVSFTHSCSALNWGNKLKFFQEYNNSLYSYLYLNTSEYDGQGNNKYSPLIFGNDYKVTLEENTTIGLIPMKPEKDFNLLTYEVFPFSSDVEALIYSCENYPLCHINKEINEKSEKLEDYKSFFINYNKKEWNNSPISKKQNMLLINCKKRLNKEYPRCNLNVNMKTDKTIIKNNDLYLHYTPQYRYIKKDHKDIYLFNRKFNPIHLIIETLSGNIQVEISPKDAFLYNKIINKEYYVIPDNKNITVTIKGLDNSIYSIYDSGQRDNMTLYFGYNYLVNIKEKNLFQISIFIQNCMTLYLE